MMRKLLTSILVSLMSFVTYGQADFCGTDAALTEYLNNNPEKIAAFLEEQQNFNKSVGSLRQQKMGQKLIIPVVVHVIHYNGVGNISKRQIDDGMRIINEDFRKLNADTAAVRAVFQPYITDMDIEFRLARKDPNGRCTEGVTRVNSYLTFNKRNEPKTLTQWDPFRYLNVWIVNSITGGSGTILGFAQFPSPQAGPNNTYGIVVRADEWGSIELATSNDGRTVTHELGHALNLLHTFQGSCGSLCQGSGDFVCDTPPQFDDNNNSCNTALNTCSNDASGGNTSRPNPYTSNVPDQLENYMGYGLACLGMFTDGQNDRVRAAIAAYTKLSTLTDTANATFTGTSDNFVSPDCVPIAEVLSFDKFVCAGDTVLFTDDSYGGPITTYNWSFPGGTPSTSNATSPVITYGTPGTYDVTLRVSNANGVDSVVLSNYVHVGGLSATHSGLNYVESFENAVSFANEWVIVSPSGNPGFERATFAASSGSSSIWVNNLNNRYVSGLDQIVSPSIKMTDVLNPSISVEVAYRRKVSSSNDNLNFYYSNDCGATWINILSTTPLFFAYDNSTQTTNFVPTQGSQWRNVTIPTQFIPAAVKNSDNVKFMFELENGNGNNIYIDDFRILGQPTSVDEVLADVSKAALEVFPNPVNDQLNIIFRNQIKGENTAIYIQDVTGRKVLEVFNGQMDRTDYKFNLDLSMLNAGVYFVTTDSNNERISKKLIVK